MWEVVMPSTYGYLKGTEGADGDQVDAYVGEDPQSERVWVVDQVDADTKAFDEHKVFVGFSNYAQVKETYDAAFSDGRGPDRRKIIRPMSMDRFKDWLASPGQTKKPVAEATIEKPAEAAPEAAATPEAAEAVEGEAAPGPAAPPSPPASEPDIGDIDVHDASGGESFGTKALKVDGKVMAAADVNIIGDEISIRDITTRPEARRKGYAKQLVDDLFRENPDSRITITNTTDDGRAFFGKNYDVAEDGRIYPKGEGPAAPEAAPEAAAEAEPTAEAEAAPATAETPTDQAETAPETPDVAPLVKADGTPYKSKRAAQGAITGRKLKDHTPVETEGGWGIVPRETPAALPEGEPLAPAEVEREGGPAEASPPEPPAPQPAEAQIEDIAASLGTTPVDTQRAPFKRWFGNSKAVAEDGSPQVVYHGTTADIAEFELPDNAGAPWGVFATNDPSEASRYAEMGRLLPDRAPNVLPLYMSLKNPLVVEGKPGEHAIADEHIQAAREAGNDGVIVRNQRGPEGEGVGHDYYLAFDPKQIKSALGNRGGFDPDSPDLQAALGTPRTVPPTHTPLKPEFEARVNEVKDEINRLAKRMNPNVQVDVVERLFHEGPELVASGAASPAQTGSCRPSLARTRVDRSIPGAAVQPARHGGARALAFGRADADASRAGDIAAGVPRDGLPLPRRAHGLRLRDVEEAEGIEAWSPADFPQGERVHAGRAELAQRPGCEEGGGYLRFR